jgi:hypothetical protein
MDDSGESRRGEPGVPDEGENWVARQLGEGWTEVEPGIYRFAAGEINEAGIRLAPSADDLIEALQPTNAEPDPSSPTRRRFGRRVKS